jgi:hypothetical protein
MRWLVLVLCLLLAPVSARAAGTYDPEIRYLAITTPHFQVVFPEGYGPIAQRTSDRAEVLFGYLARRYGWEPDGRTTVIINDQTDFANGSATIIPNKVVTLYVSQPTETSGLEDYDDWLHAVLVHELAHIFHLDMAYGLPRVGRWIFGKYVSMNNYAPTWAVEGLAVYEETIASGAGRGRSSYVDMVLRAAALEGRFPGIDQGYRSFADWPFGNVAYFFGGRFQTWLARTYGEEALMHYHRAYAADPIPYFTYLPSKLAFGESMESLWATFEAEVLADARLVEAQLADERTRFPEPERLTRYGGDLSGPRYTLDGQWIVFSTDSPKDGSRVRRLRHDASEEQVLLDDTFSKSLSFTPDDRALYVQQTEINQRYYLHNSLVRYSLRDGSAVPVKLRPPCEEEDRLGCSYAAEQARFVAPSGSLRARDPDVSPDGRHLVFVQAPRGSNQLVVAELVDEGRALVVPHVILEAEPDVQLSNPRWSPDGQKIAISRFAGGRRDVRIYGRDGALLLELTRDRALDVDPSWSTDGRWLLFASDRTGVSNLYAYDVEKDALHQLTSVLTGAFQPSVSPDQEFVVFRGYSADGFDVYRIPFLPELAPVVPRVLDEPTPRDTLPRRAPAPHPELPPLPPLAHEPLRPDTLVEEYSSLDTLLPFHDNWNLFPLFAVNERELFGRLTTVGSDALETQSYALWVEYGTATQFVGGGASYVNDQLEPTFALSAATDISSLPLFDRGRAYLADYEQQRYIGALSIQVPVLQRHLISVGYTFEHRRLWNDLSTTTLEAAAGLPVDGNFARVRLGYRYSNVRRFEHSVSLERGVQAAVALEGLSEGLGSDYEQLVASADLRHYLTLPWLHNHVLATRLFARAGFGGDLADDGFLGGVLGQSVLTTTTRDIVPLRGLVTAGLAGPVVLAASVEYRAPLWRVERGLGTLPIALRVLHAAVFADTGRVLDGLAVDADPDLGVFFDGFAAGVGAELRADILVGFTLSLDLRLGWAQLLRSPEPNRDASGPYFQIGTSY